MVFQPDFTSILALLLQAVAVKYGGGVENPFETHIQYMWVFILGLLTYGVALALHGHTQNAYHSQISTYVGAISGLISVSSLVSLLLPPLRLPVFILWGIVLVMVSRDLIHQIYLWFYSRVVTAFLQLLYALYRIWRQNLVPQPRRVPV